MTLAAAGTALLLAGCGTSTRTVYVAQHTHPAAPSPAASATPAVAQTATANEREFADAIASISSLIPSNIIAGPVMRAYRSLVYVSEQAYAAAGNSVTAETVTAIPGGYQLCTPNGNGNGPQCEELTKFVTDSAGRITGVSSDGVPVAGRIAAGAPSRMAGVVVTDVTALRSLVYQGKVIVTFKIHDVSYKAINSSPAELATFNSYSADSFNSNMPTTLAPGVTTYGSALFGTSQIYGPFELRSNDGYDLLLATSTLHKVR